MKTLNSPLVQGQDGAATRDYPAGQQVFAQGDRADTIFFIQSGRVKISVASEKGKEAVIGIMEAGQFFGEGCLQSQQRRPASAVTLSACVITSIERAPMRLAIRGNPDFSELFLRHLLSRNVRIEEDVIDQLFNSTEKRLARLLLLLANYGRAEITEISPISLSQETLAEMIGTTRSRVSFFMNKFRSLGFIDYNGKISVHQSLLDSVLRDQQEIRQEHH